MLVEDFFITPLVLLCRVLRSGEVDAEVGGEPEDGEGTVEDVAVEGGFGGAQSRAVCSGPYSHVTSESLSL